MLTYQKPLLPLYASYATFAESAHLTGIDR